MTNTIRKKVLQRGSRRVWLYVHRRWRTRRELQDVIDSHVAEPRQNVLENAWRGL